MFTLNCKGRLLTLDAPKVMGIINITPDSFYTGSRFLYVDEVLKQTEKMLHEGADIIDVGGQSTRPGSKQISIEEELNRVIDIVKSIHIHFPEAVISIDTYYSKVAYEAIAAGASIVNDISGGAFDEEILPTVSALKVPYICMHIKNTPQNMQEHPQYENVTREVLDYFVQKIDTCKKAGIHDIIIDPGFGFGKTIAHNFELLRNLSVFSILDCPVLLGVSRKSTIYKTLDITSDTALNGTTVLNTIGLMNGAHILRVHDVKEAREAVKLFLAYSVK